MTTLVKKRISQNGNKIKAGLIVAVVGGQAVLGRQNLYSTPWLTERHGYDPT